MLSSDVLDRIQDLGRHIAQLNGTRPAPMQANAPAAVLPEITEPDGLRIRTVMARLSDRRAMASEIALEVYGQAFAAQLPPNALDLTRIRLNKRFGAQGGFVRARARLIQEGVEEVAHRYFAAPEADIAAVTGVSKGWARRILGQTQFTTRRDLASVSQAENALRAAAIKEEFDATPNLSLREIGEVVNQHILIEGQGSLEERGVAPLDSLAVAEILGINPTDYKCNEAVDKDRPRAESEDWGMAATIRRNQRELTVPQIAELLCRDETLVKQALIRMALPQETETELLAQAEIGTAEEEVPVETVVDEEYLAKVERLVVWLKEGMRQIAKGKPLQGEFDNVFYLASQTGSDLGFAAAGLNRLVEEGFLVVGAAGHYNYTGEVP